MELSVPTIIGGVILIILTLLVVLVGWGLLIGFIVMGVRAIMHLVKSIRAEGQYVSDNREVELPDRRRSSPDPVRSRAPPVRRDPTVPARAERAVGHRRSRDRASSDSRTIGMVLIIFVIVLGILFLISLAVCHPDPYPVSI